MHPGHLHKETNKHPFIMTLIIVVVVVVVGY